MKCCVRLSGSPQCSIFPRVGRPPTSSAAMVHGRRHAASDVHLFYGSHTMAPRRYHTPGKENPAAGRSPVCVRLMALSPRSGSGVFYPSRIRHRVLGVQRGNDAYPTGSTYREGPSSFSSTTTASPSFTASFSSSSHPGAAPHTFTAPMQGSSLSFDAVLGTDTPSFRRFPYYAQEVLHLYRAFLRLIYRHHRPEEQKELRFRLRQEFAGRRHLKGQKVIAAALRRGHGKLEFYEQLLDAKTARQRERRLQRRKNKTVQEVKREPYRKGEENMRKEMDGTVPPAICVDEVWQLLCNVSGHTLPGLKHYPRSITLRDGVYHHQSCTSHVFSRRS